ncbi:MAG TPA: hypothetical protein EYN06_04625, partial [Myxococcales bacterium]|nr:hypothetical protein [Myxococcales bacterium]
MNNTTIVIPPRRARIMGPLTLMSGGISIACGGFITLQPGEPLILGVTLILLGLMFSCGGIMLWGMRGGVVVAQDKLILGGQSTSDHIKIPTSEIQ